MDAGGRGPDRARFGHGWYPYLAPYVGFLLLVEIGNRLPEAATGWMLLLKVAVPAGLLVYYARQGCYPEMRGYRLGPGSALDVLLGLAIAALWMALDLGQVIHASLILTETVFVTLLLSSIWCTWQLLSATIHRTKLIYAGLTGVTAGLTALCRPVAMYLPVVIAFVVGVFWLERERSSRTIWQHVCQIVVIVLLFVAALSPWLIRNVILRL